MLYENFPKIMYNGELVVDITRVLKITDAVKLNASLFDDVVVKTGETIERVAERIYGDVYKNYLIILMNDITDPFHDWPLSTKNLHEYVATKYGEGNADAVHHHTVNNKIVELDIDGNPPLNALPVTNYEHEYNLNEEKHHIRILRPEHVGIVEAELAETLNR